MPLQYAPGNGNGLQKGELGWSLPAHQTYWILLALRYTEYVSVHRGETPDTSSVSKLVMRW